MTTKWPVVALETLCNISLGKTPSRGDKKFWDPTRASEIVWMSIADLPLEAMTEVSDSKEYLTPEGAALVPIVPQGTLIMSFKLSVGRTAIAAIDLRTNEAIAAFNSLREDLIDKRFLGYFLGSQDWAADQEGQEKLMGVTLNKAKLRAVQVPLPPLDEQKRIVAKLDAAIMQLEFLDQVNVESKVSEGLFFQRFIDARINELLTEVEQSPLGDVALLVRGPFGGSLKKSMFVAAGYPIYEQQHPISGDLSSFRYFIDVEKFESMKRFAVSAGDVLMSCSGTFGKVVEVTQQAPVGVINQALLKITPSPDINSSYLKTLMTSDYFQEHVRVGVLGSAMQNVASVAELKSIPIPVPDLDTQKEFVSEAEALQMQCRRMGDIRRERSRQIIKLREVILSAAFAGEL